jgi:hypothetical protein
LFYIEGGYGEEFELKLGIPDLNPPPAGYISNSRFLIVFVEE